MTKIDYYNYCLEKYKTFTPDLINTNEIKMWFLGYSTPFWVRSEKYYKTNIKRNAPLDDEHLRKYIIPLLPTQHKTEFKITEILDNWTNADWWYNNVRDIIELMDTMYIKKDVLKDLKQYKYLPRGMYHSWLTRLYQFVNTYLIECSLSNIMGLKLDIESHNMIHSGIAKKEESLPDFTLVSGETAELKVCFIPAYDKYLSKLRENFYNTKKDDFHKADGALFFIKDKTPKLYKLKLQEPIMDPIDITANYDLSIIKYYHVDDNGNFNQNELPAIPKSLLFGLIPAWLK